ncbi:MAG: hypothetical protein DMG57_28840 [Acidobacteria bacterium]|nr:MAG: hypothetical protein DMG57_28840 [Acidobacteriota bacterium]
MRRIDARNLHSEIAGAAAKQDPRQPRRLQTKLFTGQDAPLPSFDEDPKYWIDLDVLRNPDNYGRHMTYDGVLALNDDGSPRMVDTSTEADHNRQTFYKPFGFRQVPSLDRYNCSRHFAPR